MNIESNNSVSFQVKILLIKYSLPLTDKSSAAIAQRARVKLIAFTESARFQYTDQ
ncbi:hypothetical protein [Nostoc sp. UHCC 0302]|uniref:hypothetical protein n=1 Tax=Nostoc sp. UHCC 0302 TaxID=3134896 RepID=UPI00311CDC6B